jgi:hypothetical protein
LRVTRKSAETQQHHYHSTTTTTMASMHRHRQLNTAVHRHTQSHPLASLARPINHPRRCSSGPGLSSCCASWSTPLGWSRRRRHCLARLAENLRHHRHRRTDSQSAPDARWSPMRQQEAAEVEAGADCVVRRDAAVTITDRPHPRPHLPTRRGPHAPWHLLHRPAESGTVDVGPVAHVVHAVSEQIGASWRTGSWRDAGLPARVRVGVGGCGSWRDAGLRARVRVGVGGCGCASQSASRSSVGGAHSFAHRPG